MTPGDLGDDLRVLCKLPHELTRIARAGTVCVAVVLTFLWITFNFAHADSAASPYPSLKPRLLFVDADHPATWPRGLEPIPVGELRKLLGEGSAPDSEPRTAQIEQAIYQATFHDGAFADGRAEFRFRNCRRPVLVTLEHPRPDPSRPLNFSHLRWKGAPRDASTKREVLWGIDRTGRRVVIAEPDHSRLECDWSLKGRSSLGATEFALSLPPAVVSQVLLHVPVGLSVECDQGVLVHGPNDPDGRNALWRLELGTRSSCRLRLLGSAAPGNQRVCYDQETTFVVAADRLRLQSKLQVEVFGAPLRVLRLAVPAGLHVETISYGDDFPLNDLDGASDKAREISLELPEPIFGKGRTITVEASAATRTNELSALPQIGLSGAMRREAQVQLSIRTPLKLVRFGGDAGFSQSEAPGYAIEGEETFFLRQNAGDPPLRIELAEPAPALAARTLARLDLRRDRCLLAADVVCSASRGSTFSIAFELPEAWDVTRVEAVGDASRIIDETTRPVAEHRKQVKIDFFRAVTDREARRFRIEASRSLPKSGEAIVVPVIEFPAFASQEVETLVVHGSSIDLNLSPAQAFAAFDPTAILSALADSPLRPRRAAAGETQMLVHRWTAQTAKAQITLHRGGEVSAARVQTSIDVGTSQQISERVDATIVPASPLDHVLVYVSAKGSQFSWVLATDRDRPIEGTRLPASQHAEWSLPDAGELWDLRLSEPSQSEFHLRGTRRTSSLGGARIGLTFVPIARTFAGTVQVHLPDPGQFEVDIREARALNALPGGDAGVRTLQYDRPGEVLFVRPRSIGVSKNAARFVSLKLTSFLNAGGVDDLHRAEFSLAPELAPQPFRFHLANEARICSVAVNGYPVRVQRSANEVTVPALPADMSNHIQIEYKTTAQRRLFRENRPIIVPQAQAESLAFYWRVYLAPGLLPSGLSLGLRFDEPLPTISWAERLFGPLGRSAAQMRLSSFRPDAWIVDLVGVDPESENWAPRNAERVPAGWSIWNVSAEGISGDMSLAIWHEGKFRTLAWIVCLGCAIAGLILASFASRATRRLGPLAVAAGIAFALAAPSPYALLGGACVSGVIVAVVVSRPWKKAPAPSAPTESHASRMGSTVSFELRSLGWLLAFATLSAMAVAQETPPFGGTLPRTVLSRPASTAAGQPQRTSENELIVVVPVHPGGRPSARVAALPGDNELVYVSSAALETLRRQPGKAKASQNEGTVLLSSDYSIALDERQPATINATYRVALMPGPERLLFLRLGNTSLAGANVCRVDGQPYPIRKDSEGFVLSLDPNVSSPVAASEPSVPQPAAARRPIAAERPSSATTAGASEGEDANHSATIRQPRVYEIHLTCFPNGTAKPGQFEIQIPETAHTTLRVEKSGPWQVVTAGTAGGKARPVHPGDASIDLGQTNRLQIKEGPVPTETPNSTMTAQAVQFLRLSPGLVEMDCRVTYDCENGAPEKLTWLVPSGVSVRTPGDAYRAALRSATSTGGKARSGKSEATDELVPLDFDCSGAPSGSLMLAATLLLPIDLRQSPTGAPAYPVRLPQFGAADSDHVPIAVTSNQVGISAPPGLRVIAATTEPNLSRTTKADPSFRQESFGTRKEPDLIFNCQEISILPLQLAAVIPAHKVRLMTHEAHVSADRIQWKTTAEIRTENAPAFVHVLRVDPRLKIDSISVREDGVERLVRFSQSADEVTVFLRDRAAATQDLVLTGSLPLEAKRATKLATVSLMHAVVSDERLVVSHDSDIDLAVTDAGAARLGSGSVPVTQRPGDTTATSNLLEYSLPTGPVSSSGAMPEIRVTRHADAARMAQESPSRGTKNANGLVAAPRPSNTRTAPSQQTTPSAAIASAKQQSRIEVFATLEIRRDRSVVGSTHVLLERFVEPCVRLHWPESAVLRGALFDGRPVQPTTGEGWISLAIPTEPGPHRVALHWERRPTSSLRALAHLREELPVPIDGLVNSVLLSVAVPPGFRMWSPAHFAAVDSATFTRLCDAIQSPKSKPASAVHVEPNPTASSDAPEPTRLMGRLDVGAADPVFSTWAVDTFWLRLPLAAAIFALIAIAGMHPHAARIGNWFWGHAPLTLALVGLAWWYCLSPRAVGPLSLLIALATLIIELRRRSPASSRTPPSTLQFPSGLDGR
ncbi:MAG TPA: hypothetical protein VGP63_18215 [Planctomycetaceae bacterium]|jgi:hypothetical protein|nr:hypothetical protein [Planctomycetaceae bacterium]